MNRVLAVLAMVMCFGVSANAQWYCAFTGCGSSKEPAKRTELCDQFVPEAFQLIYGPPPAGNGCTSNPVKVEYFTQVSRFVVGSEKPFNAPSVAEFEKYGFGKPLAYTMKYGDYERESVAFPGVEWGNDVPRGYLASSVEFYPYPIMSSAMTRAIAGGACVPKVVAQVPPAYQKKNDENCKEK